MVKFQWNCPFCGKAQMVTSENYTASAIALYFGTARQGDMQISHSAIRCLNDECNEATISVSVRYGKRFNGGTFAPAGDLIETRLTPRSLAKPQPAFIPVVIREDYVEACLILQDSPKASATLARRALQGMIRDFCGISEKTLYAEITKLEKLVEDGAAPRGVQEETIAAIHAVRKIGNIGAHMEADIDVIVDVDAGEARALLDLIELLFEEWYVARNTRQQKLARILEIDELKQTARNSTADEASGSEPLQIEGTKS